MPGRQSRSEAQERRPSNSQLQPTRIPSSAVATPTILNTRTARIVSVLQQEASRFDAGKQCGVPKR